MGERRSALVAEADAVTRRALVLLLRNKLGLREVGEAAEGEAFARMVTETRPEIVLLDWSLPGRPSPQALRAMRRSHPKLRLVILSLETAHALEAEALSAVFIHKASAAGQVLEQLRVLWEPSG
jgi:DNA-binding NarL/FixJ family response regulator